MGMRNLAYAIVSIVALVRYFGSDAINPRNKSSPEYTNRPSVSLS